MIRPFDEKFYLYIQVLMENFGGVRATIDLPDGRRMAGIVWEHKRWDRKNRLVDVKEMNESNKVIETK